MILIVVIDIIHTFPLFVDVDYRLLNCDIGALGPGHRPAKWSLQRYPTFLAFSFLSLTGIS